jgi:septum formation inhibitor MinC
MKADLQDVSSKTSNIKINKALTNKYKDSNLFSEKLNWAKDHFKNRDLFKEIQELEEKEEITKP